MNLHLLRHAKSSWDDPEMADHDRPLAPRGKRACRTIAAYLREQGIAPELILCSSSRRTRETLDLIGPAFEGGGAVRVEIERGLYATSAAELLARIRRAPDDVSELMLINHQPAIQELALTLATGEQTELDRLAGKFPTAALATLAIEGGWSRLGPRSARLLRFVKPRELERPGA